MGLERRGSGLYLYKKVRCGRHVMSRYVAGGEAAQLIATLEAYAREGREMERHAQRAEADQIDALLAVQEEFRDLTSGLATATLLLAGFRTHRGQWRKQRGHEGTSKRTRPGR